MTVFKGWEAIEAYLGGNTMIILTFERLVTDTVGHDLYDSLQKPRWHEDACQHADRLKVSHLVTEVRKGLGNNVDVCFDGKWYRLFGIGR